MHPNAGTQPLGLVPSPDPWQSRRGLVLRNRELDSRHGPAGASNVRLVIRRSGLHMVGLHQGDASGPTDHPRGHAFIHTTGVGEVIRQ